MALYRHWKTGKLMKRKDQPGRHIIARTSEPDRVTRHGSAWSRTWESEGMGVPIEEMDKANAEAKRHGTGAYYRPGRNGIANCCCDSKEARIRELRRRGRVDLDGGYSEDRAARPSC